MGVAVEGPDVNALRSGESPRPSVPAGAPTRIDDLLDDLDVVLFHTVDGTIDWVSPSVEDLLGYTPSELIGSRPDDLWLPEDREAAASLREDVAAGRTIERVLRIRAKDGTHRSIEVTLRPQRDAAGRPGAVGLARAVPDPATAPGAGAPRVDAFQLLAAQATDLVCMVDPGGRVVWMSQAESAPLGWSREEVIGSTFADFIHPEDAARNADARARFYRGESTADDWEGDGTIRVLRKDGTFRWMRARGSAIHDDTGAIVAVVAGLSDVDELVRLRDAAERTAADLRATLDSLLDPHIVLEVFREDGAAPSDFRFLQVNLAAAAYLQVDREQLLGRRISECFGDHVGLGLIAKYGPAADLDGPVVLNDYPATSALTGEEGFFDVRATRSGPLVTITWREVTDRHRALAALADSEHLLRAVLDSSPDPTIQFGPDIRIQYVNRAATETAGVSEDRMVSRRLTDFGFDAAFVARHEAEIRGVFRDARSLVAEVRAHESDLGRDYEVRYVPVLGPGGAVAHVIATSRDVTAERAAHAQLLDQATRDPLTGLANRAALVDEIERAVEFGRRMQDATAVLMVDLDNFKHVNDSLGHSVGDRLLIAAAHRLRTVVRGGDMVARFGGDEFVVVMRSLDDPADAARTAQRIVDAFRHPIDMDGVDVYTTASVGIAVATLDSTADDMIRESDTALYVSKDEGRDRIAIFNSELRAAVTDRLTVEAQLRPALVRGELAVWYQPEVDMATGGITAVEALLRWNHPDRGLLTAEAFIDVAEETGLVLEIGAWVLRTACADTARWNRAHGEATITVRVNLSARQIMERSVLAAIDLALEESGLPPQFLCVEITETALLRNSPRVIDHLRSIRRRGVQIALDDFGTGYASLSYLREYPVDILKIDRSFVSGITEADFDARLVGGLIALADVLEVEVTAEGVETPEQADLLIALGCERAQGFLYSRAVPAECIDTMLP